VLEGIGKISDADALGMATTGKAPRTFGVELPLVDAYPRYHQEDTVWATAMGAAPVGMLREVRPRPALAGTTVYQECIRPQRWRQTLQLLLWQEDARYCGGLLIGRRAARNLDHRQVACLEALVPHLRRALTIERHCERQQAEASGARSTPSRRYLAVSSSSTRAPR